MKKNLMTVGICARNAAAIVERAIASVLPEKGCDLIFVDDHCTDDTVSRAVAIAGKRLKVLTVPAPGGLAAARQVALDAMQTEFGTWLDADDEWIPGRAERFIKVLQAGTDVAIEPIELYDGTTGHWLRQLDVPTFLTKEITPARLFERNYLPCDAQVGFRVKTYREAGGYDATLGVSESFDILLRAIVCGARFHYGKTAGYKMYAYPGSLSRQIDRMRLAVTTLLKKHTYDSVRHLCLYAGESPRVMAWVLVSMAMFRKEWEAALKFLDEASPADADPHLILETDGPCPFQEGWRRLFQRGTILLLMGRHDAEAAKELEKANRWEKTAEGFNNLGVAFNRLGQSLNAIKCFEQAEKFFPGYLDAKLNKQEKVANRITTHPLRRHASRSEYCTTAQMEASK